MSQENILEEFNKIVATLTAVENGSEKIASKRSRVANILLTFFLFITGVTILVASVLFAFIFLAIIGFAVMLYSSLRVWDSITKSAYTNKLVNAYRLYRMRLNELDRKRFGPPQQDIIVLLKMNFGVSKTLRIPLLR